MSDDLRVNINGNSSGFQAALDSTRMQAKGFADKMAADVGKSWSDVFSFKNLAGGIAGAFGFEALKNHLHGLVEDASNIKDLAEQFDMTTDSVQRWREATRLAGVDFKTFTGALDAVRSKRQDAKTSQIAVDQLGAAGISEADAINPNLSDEQVLMRMLGSKASRAAKIDVLTKRGAKLSGALEEFAKLGVESMGFSEGDIKEIDNSAKAWEGIKRFGQKVSTKAGPGAMMIAWSKALKGDPMGALKGLGIGALSLFGISSPDMPALAQRPDRTPLQKTALQLAREEKAKEEAEKDAEWWWYLMGGTGKDTHAKIEHMRPSMFNTDALSKAGLYQASAMSFNPTLDVARQQLLVSRKIEQNTAKFADKRDSHE